MSSNDKKAKRSAIGAVIDLANGRFKESEIDSLYEIVSNIADYAGKSTTLKRSFTGWCSDGKYTRDETLTHTIKNEEDSVYIEESYRYEDDDGQSGGHKKKYTSGREIIKILDKFF